MAPVPGSPVPRYPLGPRTSEPEPRTSRRRTVLRALYAAPLVVLVLVGAVAGGRYRAERAELAGWYARAAAAEAVGRPDRALAAFAAAAGYRDADARRAAAAADLAPYRAAYRDGLAALDAGRPDEAVAALLPVARDLPGYEDALARLADARRRRAEALRGEADAAETRSDWPAAEAALAALAAADPGDPAVAPRLAALRRAHAPLVFGRDGALWLAGPDGSDERLLSDAVPALAPVWSPDRARVAFLSTDPAAMERSYALYVVGADGGGLVRLAERIAFLAPPAWSPDGTRLAYTSFAAYDIERDAGTVGVRVVEVATGRETDVTGPAFPVAINPAWSPRGDRIAFVAKDYDRDESVTDAPGEVHAVHLATGAVENLSGGGLPDAWSVTWSPAADRLLVLGLRGGTWYEPPQSAIRLLDARTGAVEPVAAGTGHAAAAVWSPDGARFAYVDGATVRVRAADGAETTVQADRELSGDLAWSPDGGAVFAAAADPDEPSLLVPLEGDPAGGAPLEVRLGFDYDGAFVSPPRWAPANPPPAAGPPTVAGTGLDHP